MCSPCSTDPVQDDVIPVEAGGLLRMNPSFGLDIPA
jgi:hypothetical protein